jgi:mannose-6-phosphate isomerase-like protein (cupin superfamily)
MKRIDAMKEPIIIPGKKDRDGDQRPVSAIEGLFDIYEWSGSGPDYLHVHYSDDEAWHILEGTLAFKFSDKVVAASAGSTVFLPAGVPHTYYHNGSTRYLIILTPRLRKLISALHATPVKEHNEIMRSFASEIVE